MKFTGKGLLLEVSYYQAKDDNKGVEVKDKVPVSEGAEEESQSLDRFRYVFLIGDQEEKGMFISNAHVESCVSDHPLLNGDEKVFDEIEVEISIREFVSKVNGQYQRVQKPVYQVVDKVGK